MYKAYLAALGLIIYVSAAAVHATAPREPSGLISRVLQKLLIIIIIFIIIIIIIIKYY